MLLGVEPNPFRLALFVSYHTAINVHGELPIPQTEPTIAERP